MICVSCKNLQPPLKYNTYYMKTLYIRPEFFSEPVEVSRSFLAASNEGYDIDPFDTGFTVSIDDQL